MSTKLKCVAVDEDPSFIDTLQNIYQESDKVEITNTFIDPIHFVRNSALLDFDLCLLAMEMNNMDGLLISKILGDKPVIFVTAAHEKLKNPLERHQLGVVLKPVNRNALDNCFDKATELVYDKKTQADEYKLFNIVGQAAKLRIKPSGIYYISVDKVNTRHKHLYSKDGSHYVINGLTLAELSKMMPSLLRANISELVSSDAIHMVGSNSVTLKRPGVNDKSMEIFLTRTYKKDFLGKL